MKYGLQQKMVSKTRDKLIEVARQLFVNKGVENTTMNDIATASEKGRRTIYTYFKNKKEIYDAVVEHESNLIISHLQEIADSLLPPVEKLREYLKKRFDVISSTANRPKTHYDRYRMLFNRDARRVEKIYERARRKEQAIFVRLLHDGVASGAFNQRQAECLPSLTSLLFMASDHIKLNTFAIDNIDVEILCENVIQFITHGIENRPIINQ